MLKLIGFLLPALIDLINKHIYDTDLRFWVSVIVCALVGTLLDYVMGGFTGIEAWATDVLMIFGMAQLGYKAIYKNSDIRTKIVGDE